MRCEELPKILAIDFTLYRSKTLHLWKSQGWGRPSILSEPAEPFLIQKITTVVYVSGYISLLLSLLPQVRFPESIFSRNQCVPIKSFMKQFFSKAKKETQPVLKVEETFSSEMDTHAKCKSWDASKPSHLLKIL